MLNRRQILGSAAVGAVAMGMPGVLRATPTTSYTHAAIIEKFRVNLYNSFLPNINPHEKEFHETISLPITKHLVEMDILKLENIMEAPTCIIGGKNLMAISRAILDDTNRTLTLEKYCDTLCMGGESGINRLLYDEAVKLAVTWMYNLQYDMTYPYVPVMAITAVDSVTFMPKVGFKTRFGISANHKDWQSVYLRG